ncbi:unnamed protein product [Rotaria magnacalcarata]
MALFAYRLITILVFSISQVRGSCFLDTLKSSPSNNTSKKQIDDIYCDYGGIKYAINTTWTLPYPDCLNCQCSQYGLECCGFGSEAGIIEPPENCQLVKGTCEVRFVRQDDPSKPCDQGDVIKPIRHLKKKKFLTRRTNSTIT